MNNSRTLNIARYLLLLTLLALLFGSSSCDPANNPKPIVTIYYEQPVNFRKYAEWSPVGPGNNGIYQAAGSGMWMMYDITRIVNNSPNAVSFTFKLKNVYAEVGTNKSTFVDMKKLDSQPSIQDLFAQEDYTDTIAPGAILSRRGPVYIDNRLGRGLAHLRFTLLMPDSPRREQAETTDLLYNNENPSAYVVLMQREPPTTDVRYEEQLNWNTMVYDVFGGQWLTLVDSPVPRPGSDNQVGPTLINGSGGSHGNSNTVGVVPPPNPYPHP